jgi:hypothetical protein
LCLYPAWPCNRSAWRLSSFCGPAVKENAAEACTTACQDEQSAGLALAASQGGDKDADNARIKEAFESCYTKCVAQETKDVAEERQKVCACAASAFQLCVDLKQVDSWTYQPLLRSVRHLGRDYMVLASMLAELQGCCVSPCRGSCGECML